MARLSDGVVAAGLRELVRLRSGHMPTDRDLENAPHLSGWVFGEMDDGHRRLGGVVTGHPRLPAGWCWTSIVLFVSPDLRWARTISRYYRLGEPMALNKD
ncbi:DUF6634 family protein [Devosia sp. ZW T5_3]|uniref:DUF6634 family protein n=1 Tax=Devosia sp. ZW T5_3 TaxID=3378085 RepID=UPI003853F43A